jgi:hypothetical protein
VIVERGCEVPTSLERVFLDFRRLPATGYQGRLLVTYPRVVLEPWGREIRVEVLTEWMTVGGAARLDVCYV